MRTEAETIAWAWDVRTETCSEGGIDVTSIENGDFIKVKGVDFGAGASSLDVWVASTSTNSRIEVRLDTQTGKLVGTCTIASTGGAQLWNTQTCAISGAASVHDLFFVSTGGTGSVGGTKGRSGASTSSGGATTRGGTSSISGGSGAAQGGSQNVGGKTSIGGSASAAGGTNSAGSVGTGGSVGAGGQVSTGGSAMGGTNALAASAGQPSTGTPGSSLGGGTQQAAGGAIVGAAGDASTPSESGCGCAVPGKS